MCSRCGAPANLGDWLWRLLAAGLAYGGLVLLMEVIG